MTPTTPTNNLSPLNDFLNDPHPNANLRMTKRDNLSEGLEKWWWDCNGTGTDACSLCRPNSMCSWHSARLEDLKALFAKTIEELIGPPRDYENGEYADGYFAAKDELRDKLKEMVK